jgi:hypothetical protein
MPYRTPGGGTSNTPYLDFLQGKGTVNSRPITGVGSPRPVDPNILDSVFSNIQNAGQSLASQLAGLSQASQQVDPLQALVESLAGMTNTGGTGLNQADYEQALNDSAAQIKKAFGAEIGAVKASSAYARKQTKRSKKQIRAMYRALSNDYKKSSAGEVAQGQKIANELGTVAANTQGNVTQNADKILSEQAALAQGLGVQSAAPDVIAKQQAKVQDTVNNMQSSAQNAENLAIGNSGNQQRYFDRQASGSLLEGTNQRAGLVKQLQQFLLGNQGKIADIKGNRAQALGSNAQQMAASFSKGQSDAAQNQFDNSMSLANLLLKIKDSNKPSNSATADLPKSIQQYNSIVGNDQQVGGLLQQLFSSPDFVNQQYRSGKQDFRMNPMKAADEAYQAAIAAGLTQDQAIRASLAAQLQQSSFGG